MKNRDEVARAWFELLASLQQDMKARGDSELEVTIGASEAKDGIRWGYQTGNPEFHGGAYGHPAWASITLTPESDCAKLADEAMEEILDSLAA